MKADGTLTSIELLDRRAHACRVWINLRSLWPAVHSDKKDDWMDRYPES